MNEDILVPTLGESISEATVSKWLKKSGEKLIADEPVVELETDKVNLEVPSPVDGVLLEIKSKEGESVKVGAILGVVAISAEKTNIKKPIEQKIEKPTKKEKKLEEPKVFNENTLNKEKKISSDTLVLTNEIDEEKKNKTSSFVTSCEKNCIRK